MTSLLPVSVGVGLVVSLLFSELFGLAAGGLVVPGYLALSLNRPLSVVLTLAVALVTVGLMHGLTHFMILYGRRRTALTILVGYALAMISRSIPGADTGDTVIGFIIPGLIALWMMRQGIVQTVTSIITVSVMVRLVLIIVMGDLP